jgi:lactosylceramide 4-alpha-galactosyltransferase
MGDELNTEINEALKSVLLHHENVQVLYVDMDLLFNGTPVEEFHKRQLLKTSKFLAVHTSDAIRILTLWLYGGKYFDLDIITVRNLTGINNFIIHETNFPVTNIANSFFAYEKRSPIGEYILKRLNKEYNGGSWDYNGIILITEAMKWYTNISLCRDMNSTNLKIFTKIRYDRVFPIESFELNLYFDESKSGEAFKRLSSIPDLIAMHTNNNNMKNEKVFVGSKQAYSVIAQQYCPRSYWSAHKIF